MKKVIENMLVILSKAYSNDRMMLSIRPLWNNVN